MFLQTVLLFPLFSSLFSVFGLPSCLKSLWTGLQTQTTKELQAASPTAEPQVANCCWCKESGGLGRHVKPPPLQPRHADPPPQGGYTLTLTQ